MNAENNNTNDMPAGEEVLLEESISSEKPLRGHIAMKAYFAFLNSGSTHGCDLQHWLAAEKELMVQQHRTRSHGAHN